MGANGWTSAGTPFFTSTTETGGRTGGSGAVKTDVASTSQALQGGEKLG
ncbi:MAG TPA: hypothetical protein VGM92_02995 [Candidatus Kapabacteria bacterium]